MLDRILTLQEAEDRFFHANAKIIYVKSSVHEGLWYNKHVDHYFLASYDTNHPGYRAITCLTKYIKTSSWSDELTGWFYDKDIDILTSSQYRVIENRDNKIKEILDE